MKKASWRSECTFRRFYEKDILPVDIAQRTLTKFSTETLDCEICREVAYSHLWLFPLGVLQRS